ncbi:hypothetical protein DXG01_001135 [Tephrocybe rancida]|nr:hypothetical protein DXG01_001135 [Tephrocybe rancida]
MATSLLLKALLHEGFKSHLPYSTNLTQTYPAMASTNPRLKILVAKWKPHFMKALDAHAIPKGWRPGHWHVSRLASMLTFLRRAVLRHFWAQQQYLGFLDSLEFCKAGMDTKGIRVQRLDNFLQGVDELRLHPASRIMRGVSSAIVDEIEQLVNEIFEGMNELLKDVEDREGLSLDVDHQRVRVGQVYIVKELEGEPKEFPPDLIEKIHSEVLMGNLCYQEYLTMQPTLPDEEIALLTELRYADYEYRSEKIVDRGERIFLCACREADWDRIMGGCGLKKGS